MLGTIGILNAVLSYDIFNFWLVYRDYCESRKIVTSSFGWFKIMDTNFLALLSVKGRTYVPSVFPPLGIWAHRESI
jgi:hypothetical protein